MTPIPSAIPPMAEVLSLGVRFDIREVLEPLRRGECGDEIDVSRG